MIRRVPKENDKERLLQSIFSSPSRKVVIIGIGKNAGKTTFLNWLIERLSGHRLGIMTTGRDGEDLDLVEKTKKPKVLVTRGTVFTCRAAEISKHSPHLTILNKFHCKAGGENVWLVESLCSLEVEIIGPPSVKEQTSIAEEMLEYGLDYVLIDGSIDRKTIGAADSSSSLILTASPAYGSLESIRQEFRKFTLLAELEQIDNPEIKAILADQQNLVLLRTDQGKVMESVIFPFSSLIGREKELLNRISKLKDLNNYLYSPTGFTEKSYIALQSMFSNQSSVKLIIQHPFNLYLNEHILQKLISAKRLLTISKLSITGFGLNSFSVTGNHLDCRFLRDSIRAEFSIPAVDVREVS